MGYVLLRGLSSAASLDTTTRRKSLPVSGQPASDRMSASTVAPSGATEASVLPASGRPSALSHSLLPILVLVLILGTMLWGPFVTTGLAAIFARLLTRIA